MIYQRKNLSKEKIREIIEENYKIKEKKMKKRTYRIKKRIY